MATVGIDLGTTNSLVSVWQDDKCTLIPNNLGEYLTPSVVGIDENGDAGMENGERASDLPSGKYSGKFQAFYGDGEDIYAWKQAVYSGRSVVHGPAAAERRCGKIPG